jgi:mannitol-1-phosphate/altronate dehydrogenase
MSVTPSDLWAHAQNLQQSSEAEVRTKISRLYYALYSHALAFEVQLPSKGKLSSGSPGGYHKQLADRLENPTVSDTALYVSSRALGLQQKLAHKLRVRADYKLTEPVGSTELARCLQYVKAGMRIQLQ